MMRLKSLFHAALLFCWVLFPCAGSAQTATVNSIRQSLLSLIAKLQSADQSPTDGHTPSPTPMPAGPSLAALGPARDVKLSVAVAAQGLLNVGGVVVHENGISEWKLGVLDNGEIAIYAFTIVRVEKPVVERASATLERNAGYLNNDLFREYESTPVIHKRANAGARTYAPATFDWGESAKTDHATAPWHSTITSMPRPAPGGPAISLSAPIPAIDPRVVEFLFASTRQQITGSPGQNISFDGERAALTFGAASVRIPDDHKIGQIELPSSWKLFGLTWSTTPDEHLHFIVKRVVPLSEDVFAQVIKAKNARSALVFVHGFNTSFEDALYRNAQIVWDLQYSGVSVLFTWASRGEAVDYLYDQGSAYLARDAFIALLKKLKNDYGIEEINVLAHSMGNLVVLDALSNYAQTANPVQIARLVMAAPDVDGDQFKVLAPSAKAIVGGMTLYASSADRAMTLSRTLAGGKPRAGDVPAGGPIILPNIDTIDVTAIGNDIFGLNHNVFASSRDVLEDISAMLKTGLPPPRLIQIRGAPEPPAVRTYWKYVP